MDIDDSYVFFVFFLMVCMVGYTLYSIFLFMPVELTCHDEFEIINKCKCVPCDAGVLDLFNADKACSPFEFNRSIMNISKKINLTK